MHDRFYNLYDDPLRADAYASLELTNTYYLAYRDLPAILAEHVRGTRALDFGCGTGRSTRFLRALGYDAVGVDIAEPMVARARQRDADGEYHVIAGGELDRFPADGYDLVLSALTFDNVATLERKVMLFRGLGRLLSRGTGRLVTIVSSPELYVREWASFTTREFPENRTARNGDTVRLVMLDVHDRRPVEDVYWTDDAYRDVYRRAGLDLLQTYRPLGSASDPYDWISETTVAPWAIYVLGRWS